MDEHPSDQHGRHSNRECHEKAHLVSSGMEQATEDASRCGIRPALRDAALHPMVLAESTGVLKLPCAWNGTSRGASAQGSGFSRTPYATLPSTVVAAMPSAIVATATAAYAGCRRGRTTAP